MKRSAAGKLKPRETGSIFTGLRESSGSWDSKDDGNLLIFTHNDIKGKEKIAAFDMDGTLIVTKSGHVFPKDCTDWQLFDPSVSKKLKQADEDGYKIVIFTNQKGLSSGKVDVKSFKYKIEDIIRKIGVPVQAFVSLGDGVYRKPCTGMWDELEKRNDNVIIDKTSSVYVGDAAGRMKTKTHPKKDHSFADRFFASNIGIPFQTPEQYFLNKKGEEPWGPIDFDPAKLLSSNKTLLEPEDSKLPWDSPELIIMVGFPGSGKSTFAKKLETEYGYAIVNRDTLGTWQKCVSNARDQLTKGKSVVIDNTNPDKESRARYVAVAKEMKAHCRCFVMTGDLAHAKHNVKYRLLTKGKSAVEVGTMVLRMFQSKLQKPSLEERFDSIVHVNFIPEFDTEDNRILYGKFLTD